MIIDYCVVFQWRVIHINCDKFREVFIRDDIRTYPSSLVPITNCVSITMTPISHSPLLLLTQMIIASDLWVVLSWKNASYIPISFQGENSNLIVDVKRLIWIPRDQILYRIQSRLYSRE